MTLCFFRKITMPEDIFNSKLKGIEENCLFRKY